MQKTSDSHVEHHIETIGPLVFVRVRPLPQHKYRIAKEEWSQWCTKGSTVHLTVLGLAHSIWSKRKMGNYYVATTGNWTPSPCWPYPIPRQHDFTFNLRDKKILSKIDLQKAYYQINNREEDIKKTAVITPFGLFEFTKMCIRIEKCWPDLRMSYRIHTTRLTSISFSWWDHNIF